MNEEKLRDLTALIALADGTRFAELARDEAKLRAYFLGQMRASADPMTREIGEGISAGTMTWHTVATHSAYAEYVQHSVEAMRQFDFGVAIDELAGERAANERTAQRQQDEEDEPFEREVLRDTW